jgi:8-amino-7-oxononanoate synthase
MGLGDQIRQQLAAKALQRQLERVAVEANEPFVAPPAGTPASAQAAARESLCSFTAVLSCA